MNKRKLGNIFMYTGLAVLVVALVIGIITWSNVSGYNNTEIPIPESEYSIVGQGAVAEAISTKNGYLNAVLGLVPWLVGVAIVGVVLMIVSIILKFERKEVKVR